MPKRVRWHELSTEARNPRSLALDALTSGQAVDLMLRDHARILPAIGRERARIAKASMAVASALAARGRLIFAGAGTSGRLGVLEAAELPPTFGIAPTMAVGVMAGGSGAVRRAKEGVEDDERGGSRAIARLRPRPTDVVIGISASGITPFVRGAVTRARQSGASVIGITCDPRSDLRRLSDIAIVLAVGPEIVSGSTRLKAGTATKIVLNILTTTAMARAGKTYGNLMVDLRPGSDKLRDRARRIVAAVTRLDGREADKWLERAGGHVKAAILMHELGITRAAALSRLRIEPRLRKLLRGA